MAKTKKVAAPEEVLQESEYLATIAPFQIPQNWCWTSLGKVCHLNKGESIENTLFPYWDAKSLRGTKEAEIVDSGCIVEAGEKVILVDGENSGEVFSIPSKGYMGSTFKVLDVCKSVNPIYIQYFIDSYREKLRNNKVGSAIPHLNKELFFDLSIPLPPLTEQNRIVEKIDSMFQKLDEAKELIQQSIDNFADRRAAILHKAFAGELTEGWRKQHGVALDYRDVCLGDVIEEFKYGTSLKSTYEYSEIPVLRIPNIGDEEITFDDVKYLPFDCLHNVDLLRNGDILTIRSNGSRELVGKSALVKNINKPVTFASFLIRIRPCTEEICPEYLVPYLNSNDIRDQMFAKAKSSSGIHNINTKELSSLQIKVPKIEEQQEIVRTLDNFFEKEDKTKELLDMLDKIDEMKKAILSRAFRGELGTNAPADEPAVELLKKVLNEE